MQIASFTLTTPAPRGSCSAAPLDKALFVMLGGDWLIPANSVAAMQMVLSTFKRNEWISILLALSVLVAIYWAQMGLAKRKFE